MDLIDLPLCSDFSNSWFSPVNNILLLITHDVMKIGITHREKKLKIINIICRICRRKDSIHVAATILTHDLCSLHSHKQSLMKIRKLLQKSWYKQSLCVGETSLITLQRGCRLFATLKWCAKCAILWIHIVNCIILLNPNVNLINSQIHKKILLGYSYQCGSMPLWFSKHWDDVQ